MSSSPQSAFREGETQASSARLPPPVLAAAVLSVLNGLLALGFFLAWILAPQAAVSAVRGSGGAGMLSGLLGIGVGAWAQRKQKRAGITRGSRWTTAAVLAGCAAMLMWLLIPMAAAVNSILGDGA